MHHSVRRERPDVPARVPSSPGDNQRTRRRSSSRTPRTLQPPKQLRTPVFGAGSRRPRGLEVVDSSAGPESRTRVPFLACVPASDCGSPDPRPCPARMRHRAPPLPVHPPHCRGTGDAWLPPSRVPSSPGHLRLHSACGSAGPARLGRRRQEGRQRLPPPQSSLSWGRSVRGPGPAPPTRARASRAPTTRAAPRTSPAGSRGEVTAPETPPPRPGPQLRRRHTPGRERLIGCRRGGRGLRGPGQLSSLPI